MHFQIVSARLGNTAYAFGCGICMSGGQLFSLASAHPGCTLWFFTVSAFMGYAFCAFSDVMLCACPESILDTLLRAICRSGDTLFRFVHGVRMSGAHFVCTFTWDPHVRRILCIHFLMVSQCQRGTLYTFLYSIDISGCHFVCLVSEYPHIWVVLWMHIQFRGIRISGWHSEYIKQMNRYGERAQPCRIPLC